MLFQPSEYVKLVLIMVVARYFANLGGRNVTWKEIFKAFALVGIPMLLVLKQPDLGTTLCLHAHSRCRTVFGRHQPAPGADSAHLRAWSWWAASGRAASS